MDSKFTQEVIDEFYKIYDNNNDNLKKVSPALRKMGLNNIELVKLTMRELKLGLAESAMLLEVPDYNGG
jgi:NAD(P)H-nitrite reductase large subunit